MKYDIVWYLPEHKAKALKLVKQLALEDIRARDLDPHLCGLRFCLDGAPIPFKDGTFSGKYGTCVMTNRLGTAGLQVGARRMPQGDPWLSAYAIMEEIEPGCIGGYWLPNVWEDHGFVTEARHQEIAEQSGARAALKDRQERFAEECVTVAAALGPYLKAAATPWIHGRIKQAVKVCFQRRMSSSDLDRLQRWISRMSPEEKEDPFSDLDAEQYARVCFSDMVRRKSVTKQAARV